ncbi:MAG: hypothetical protein AABZ31_04640 [Bdellovibrionota bacterium]
MKYTPLALIFLSLSLSFTASAELDAASKEALEKTNSLLKDKKQRDAYNKTDAKAQQADAFAHKVGGSEAGTQSIYELSAKVFEKLVQKYNGDPAKMKEVLERAQKDPAGFANSEFSAEELKALRELSSQIPAAQAPAK